MRKHWRHSLGAILSIVVGFIAIGLFEGYLSDLENIQREWYVHRGMTGHVIVEQRGAFGSEGRQDPWKYALDLEKQAAIEAFLQERAADVATRNRVLQVGGLASTGRSGVVFIAWGLDVAESVEVRGTWAWNVTAGQPLHQSGENAVIVGNGLGALLGCTGPPPETAIGRDGRPTGEQRPMACAQTHVQLSSTTEHGQLNVVDPVIVGLFDGGMKDVDNRFVHMPLPLAQRLADTDAVTMYVVLLRDARQAPAFAAALDAFSTERGLGLAAVPWDEHVIAEMYRRSTSILSIYRNLVVLIVVAIAGMSVLTTMLKAVNERVREIGTLRSIGFRRRHIVGLFTVEAAVLAAVSSGVGLLATWALIGVINSAGLSYSGGVAATPIPLTISLVPAACVFALVFLSGVAMLAALLPARRAARLSIPDALGHAG
ncbi:MAG: FtsX-like permease family protein [Acidobacteria bacterium]|nr:FtsX-like permease family protein [Acidobacteriota bacterium]